jgi:hypothetical protein
VGVDDVLPSSPAERRGELGVLEQAQDGSREPRRIRGRREEAGDADPAPARGIAPTEVATRGRPRASGSAAARQNASSQREGTTHTSAAATSSAASGRCPASRTRSPVRSLPLLLESRPLGAVAEHQDVDVVGERIRGREQIGEPLLDGQTPRRRDQRRPGRSPGLRGPRLAAGPSPGPRPGWARRGSGPPARRRRCAAARRRSRSPRSPRRRTPREDGSRGASRGRGGRAAPVGLRSCGRAPPPRRTPAPWSRAYAGETTGRSTSQTARTCSRRTSSTAARIEAGGVEGQVRPHHLRRASGQRLRPGVEQRIGHHRPDPVPGQGVRDLGEHPADEGPGVPGAGREVGDAEQAVHERAPS